MNASPRQTPNDTIMKRTNQSKGYLKRGSNQRKGRQPQNGRSMDSERFESLEKRQAEGRQSRKRERHQTEGKGRGETNSAKGQTSTSKKLSSGRPDTVSESDGVRRQFDVGTILLHGTDSQKAAVLDDLRRGTVTIGLDEFNEIVTTLLRQRRLREALPIAELSERQPLCDLIVEAKAVKTYTIILDVFGKGYQLARAFSLFYGMARNGTQPNAITYNTIIAACSRSNEPDLAYEVFDEMQANGLKPDKFTYGSLIDSCAKSGQVERAFEISRMMSNRGVMKDQTIYSALLEACGRGRQLDRAFVVFEDMKRNGVWPNLITFSVLIDICANAKEPERAFQIFSEIKHWGYPKANVIVYTALIDACSKGGWPERAELVLESMVENGVRPNEITFGALMEGWARQGKIDRAFKVLERMEREHNIPPNSILVGGLIDACRRSKAPSRVKDIWEITLRLNLHPSRAYYPALIAMALTMRDMDLACAIVLHAYARGYLRLVALKSENPASYALACAMVYLRHELSNNEIASEQHSQRLKTAFGSTAMTAEQVQSISWREARDFCMSWGDSEARELKAALRRKSSQRDKYVSNRNENGNSADVRKAKDEAKNKLRGS